jgi:hypothetical protein
LKYVVHCKKEKYDVYIGRPSKWGNPFSHQIGTLAKYKVATRNEAISKFEDWILSQPDMIVLAKQELRGKVLGCFCDPLSCHGHVLARIANEP